MLFTIHGANLEGLDEADPHFNFWANPITFRGPHTTSKRSRHHSKVEVTYPFPLLIDAHIKYLERFFFKIVISPAFVIRYQIWNRHKILIYLDNQ